MSAPMAILDEDRVDADMGVLLVDVCDDVANANGANVVAGHEMRWRDCWARIL
jgi:hypothetical protein